MRACRWRAGPQVLSGLRPAGEGARIDWHYLAEQVRHGILNLERGFPYSLRNLLLRPGRLIRDYIEGQRARQVKPLTLLLVTAAAVVLVGRLVADGDVIGSTISAGVGLAGNPELAGSPAAQEATRTLESWVNRNFALVTLLLLPLEAAGLRLAFRGVGGLNYPEWLVVTAFLSAQGFVFMAAGLLLQRWIPGATAWAVYAAMACLLFSLARFFAGYPWWKTVLRGILGLLLYTVVQSLATAVALALYQAVR